MQSGIMDNQTLFQGDFLAKTSQAQATAQESKAREADYGVRWQESSVKYDRATSSWKTHRCLWDEDLPWCSVTLPKWGMMRRGELWGLAMLVFTGVAPEYGDWIKVTPQGEQLSPSVQVQHASVRH